MTATICQQSPMMRSVVHSVSPSEFCTTQVFRENRPSPALWKVKAAPAAKRVVPFRKHPRGLQWAWCVKPGAFLHRGPSFFWVAWISSRECRIPGSHRPRFYFPGFIGVSLDKSVCFTFVFLIGHYRPRIESANTVCVWRVLDGHLSQPLYNLLEL